MESKKSPLGLIGMQLASSTTFRKLKKKYERICRTVYKRLIDYTECERLIGARNPLYDGGDLYPWTNNDSLIDWSVVNYNTDDGIGGGGGGGIGNGTSSPTKQTLPVLPPFELYQVGDDCLRILKKENQLTGVSNFSSPPSLCRPSS